MKMSNKYEFIDSTGEIHSHNVSDEIWVGNNEKTNIPDCPTDDACRMKESLLESRDEETIFKTFLEMEKIERELEQIESLKFPLLMRLKDIKLEIKNGLKFILYTNTNTI